MRKGVDQIDKRLFLILATQTPHFFLFGAWVKALAATHRTALGVLGFARSFPAVSYFRGSGLVMFPCHWIHLLSIFVKSL
jgi:hypothetical protein